MQSFSALFFHLVLKTKNLCEKFSKVQNTSQYLFKKKISSSISVFFSPLMEAHTHQQVHLHLLSHFIPRSLSGFANRELNTAQMDYRYGTIGFYHQLNLFTNNSLPTKKICGEERTHHHSFFYSAEGKLGCKMVFKDLLHLFIHFSFKKYGV